MANQMFDIRDKVAVVTGAGGGIGHAVASRFRNAGAEVVMVDVVDARSEADAIGAHFIQADVSSECDVERAMNEVAEKFGQLDIVVLNAGIAGKDDGVPIQDCSGESLRQVFAVNCHGVFYGIKHASTHMEDGGSIILTSSQAAMYTAPNTSEYTASKHAVIGLAKSGALELGPKGIRINAVCPGYVDTPINAKVSKVDEIVKITQAIGRLLTTDDVIGLFHFLASPESYMITGQALVIDGGKTAGMTQRFVSMLEKI